MHVLIIPSERYVPEDSPLDGVFQQHQAQALKKIGFKVGVISPPELVSLRRLGKGKFASAMGTQVEDDQGIPVFRYRGWYWIPRLRQAQLWLWLRAWKSLFKRYVIRHGMPDIIHAHNALFAGVLACKIKKQWRIPYVLTEHSTAYARGLVQNPRAAYARGAFQNADKLLVVSPSLGHVLEKTIGESAHSWEWVSNILDGIFEENGSAKEPNRPSRDQFHFLNVGSLIERKGHADLLRAFALKFEDNIEVQLRIGGDGPLRNELEALSRQLKIDRQVIFLGNLSRPEVLVEMQNCDAYVHSSSYETFGVVLIEALSGGKPVISTDCGGPQCIVRKENGVLVPPKDVTALGEAMFRLRENIDRYDATWIKQDCLARFGREAITGQLSDIYRAVCGTKEKLAYGERAPRLRQV